MLELTLTSPVIVGIVLLALALTFGWGWFNYRIQQKKLELQATQLKEQRFANKRARIIREISARLPQYTQTQITTSERTTNQVKLIAPIEHEKQLETQLETIAPSKLPIEIEQSPKAESLEFIKPLEAINNLPENSSGALITAQDQLSAPPEMPLEGKAAPYMPVEIPQSPPSTRNLTTRPLAAPGLQLSQPPQKIAKRSISGAVLKSTPQPIPRLAPIPAPRPFDPTIETTVDPRNGPVINFQKTSANEIQRHRVAKTDFHLNLDDSLYEQIKDYARWVASQSEFFTLEVHHTNEEEEFIPLLFDTHELEKRNGHWFELFAPINLDDLSSQIKSNKGDVFCPFSQLAIEQLCAPARKIFNRVKEEGSPRYVQVMKESALGEFIDFLDDFKNILATQPAE